MQGAGDLFDNTIRTTTEKPRRIDVPWEKYEQDLVFVEMFYEEKQYYSLTLFNI